ncbi:hypothetical protein LDENG_00230400, partial [Lucifuga dentata]
LLSALPKNTTSHLQLIQSSAARVLSRTRRATLLLFYSLYTGFLSVFVLILRFCYWFLRHCMVLHQDMYQKCFNS